MEYKAVVKRKSDDELQHKSHKYIKREKVNGKWRYYYDVGAGNHASEPYVDGKKLSPIRGYSKFQDIIGQDEKDKYWNTVREVDRAERQYLDRHNDGDSMHRVMDNLEYKQASKHFKEARERYMKTPLGKLTRSREKIYAGKKKVASLLEKASKKLKNNPEYYY